MVEVNMSEQIEQIELEEFIKKTLSEIEKGAEIGKRRFKDAIEFEISISKTQKIGGDVKIYVAKGSGEQSEEKIAKIKFQIYPDYPKDNLEDLPRQAVEPYGNPY